MEKLNLAALRGRERRLKVAPASADATGATFSGTACFSIHAAGRGGGQNFKLEDRRASVD
jgi:hypothetical protein